MCGIAGIVGRRRNNETAAQLIHQMCDVIRHRGPDEEGTWVGEGAALGMRRLSIIDLAGGQQPIFNEDGSILVIQNGEIYNYRQLMQQLKERGHRFRSNSDTEVIVHAYEEFGDDCVKHLRGMFSFAIWDQKRQRLYAARDRFGKKPLNYYWDGKELIFGSEIKSILQAGIPREVDPIALDEYLVYRCVPAPYTMFKGVMKVPAGHTLVYENGKVSLSRYWELPFTPTCPDDEVTAVEKTQALLKNAVEARLMSEVPLGAFLSGGVDSSIVVALMSSMMSQPVKTFSIGFEEDGFSELPHARKIAQHFHTEHHEFLIRPQLVSILPQLAWAYDEPFADASMLPTHYVSKLAREHVTVALTGDGGDEIFGGYMHYKRERMISRIPQPLRSLLGFGSRFMPDGMRGQKRLRSMPFDLPTRAVQAAMLFRPEMRLALYTTDHFARVREHNPYESMMAEFRAVCGLDVTAQQQYVDVRRFLTDDILVKVDKASMFNSLETRAPLLDQELAEYVTSLPSRIRTRGGTLKYLLKKAAAPLLPAEVLTRRKQGFEVPIKHWFRGDLNSYAHELLLSPRAQQRGIFEPQFIRDLLKSHSRTTLINHGNAIWTLLCLEHWFQVYMDEAVTPAGRSWPSLSKDTPDLSVVSS
jgi:asparagine synthase (glutamine-hydrolysing)